MTIAWRAYFLAVVSYAGAFMFGYDTGVAGSVIALSSFQVDFGLRSPGTTQTKAQKTRTANLSANVVSVLQAGAFVGALGAAPLTDLWGRRYALMFFGVIFILGGIIQTASQGHLGAIYAGRVIAGVGVGACSALGPTYVSECAPKKTRGRIAGMFQLLVVSGVAVSYWTTYGVQIHMSKTSSAQWRVPLGVQIIPGGLLILGLLFTKESPRWLARKGRNDEAIANLAYLRHVDQTDADTLEEFAEIRASIDQEIQETEGVSWREALLPGNRIRFFLGFWLMTLQQWGGQNIVNYYAPTIFESVGVTSADSSLFASGIYGLVKIVATAAFLLIGIEQIGRRFSLGFGGLGMGILFYIVGAIGKTHPPVVGATSISHASIAMVAMIYLFSVVYSFSWGPVPWVYGSEIFPNRLRAYGVSLTAATQWIMNFGLSRTAPVAEVNLGFNLFIVFGSVNIFNGITSFFLPETKGRSLEEMDLIFGVVSDSSRAAAIADVEKDLHLDTHHAPRSPDSMGSASDLDDKGSR